jgi:hypothetical protein
VYFCVMRSGHYFFLVGWGRGTVENWPQFSTFLFNWKKKIRVDISQKC